MTRVFWAGCTAYVAAWLWAAWRLPERVPMHFGLDGEVDRWAARGVALVGLGLLGLAVALLLWGSMRLVTRDHLAWVNAPHKGWWLATRERRARFRAMLTRDLAGIGAATMVLLAGAVLAMTTSAAQEQPRLPGWFPVLAVGFLLGMAAWTIWSYAGRYRPDPGTAE